MKKLFFLLAIIFLLPLTVQAKLYQNYTYNFQIDFADRWYDDNKAQENLPELITTRVNTSKDGKLGMFWLYVSPYKKYSSIDDLTLKQKNQLFMKTSNQLLKKYQKSEIYYGQYELVGDYSMLVVKISAIDQTKKAIQVIEVLTIADSKMYTFRLVTQNLTGEQEKQFMQMLKTFKNLH